MWQRVVDMVRTGRAIMVYAANNEQGLAFQVHEHSWEPIDIEGVTLMLRPTSNPPAVTAEPGLGQPTSGWSKVSKKRRFGNRAARPDG
jgi:CRISPR-associated protein Cas2